jgi:hypothetical protein
MYCPSKWIKLKVVSFHRSSLKDTRYNSRFINNGGILAAAVTAAAAGKHHQHRRQQQQISLFRRESSELSLRGLLKKIS